MDNARRFKLALALLTAMAPASVAAAPQTLDCVLRDIEIKGPGAKFDIQVAAEQRAVTVTFDDDAGSLAITTDGTAAALENVAITQTSMTGAGDHLSLGVDRSSWRIVFQTYGEGTVRSEFGSCRLRR
jgi:hypothetical protein